MSATNMNLNSPKLTTWLMILVLIFTLILCKVSAAQSVPVNKEVLNYLLERNAKAVYLEKDLKLTDSIIVAQKEIITHKDSLLINRNEALRISQNENEMCNAELKSSQSENKKANRKVKFFKFTTVSVAILSIAQYVKSLLH